MIYALGKDFFGATTSKNVRLLLWSLLNRVFGVLACSRALRLYVLACSRALRDSALTCLRAWRAWVLMCLRAYVLSMLACLRAWCACMRACVVVTMKCFIFLRICALGVWCVFLSHFLYISIPKFKNS